MNLLVLARMRTERQCSWVSTDAVGLGTSMAGVRQGRKDMGALRRADPVHNEHKRTVSLVPLIMDYLEQGPLFPISPCFSRIHR